MLSHILFGFSASLLYSPATAVSGHWFLRRRSTAVGIVVCGSGLGGVIYPIALRRMFDELGEWCDFSTRTCSRIRTIRCPNFRVGWKHADFRLSRRPAHHRRTKRRAHATILVLPPGASPTSDASSSQSAQGSLGRITVYLLGYRLCDRHDDVSGLISLHDSPYLYLLTLVTHPKQYYNLPRALKSPITHSPPAPAGASLTTSASSPPTSTVPHTPPPTTPPTTSGTTRSPSFNSAPFLVGVCPVSSQTGSASGTSSSPTASDAASPYLRFGHRRHPILQWWSLAS